MFLIRKLVIQCQAQHYNCRKSLVVPLFMLLAFDAFGQIEYRMLTIRGEERQSAIIIAQYVHGAEHMVLRGTLVCATKDSIFIGKNIHWSDTIAYAEIGSIPVEALKRFRLEKHRSSIEPFLAGTAATFIGYHLFWLIADGYKTMPPKGEDWSHSDFLEDILAVFVVPLVIGLAGGLVVCLLDSLVTNPDVLLEGSDSDYLNNLSVVQSNALIRN